MGIQVWSHDNAYFATFLKTDMVFFREDLMLWVISTVPLLVIEAGKVFLFGWSRVFPSAQ